MFGLGMAPKEILSCLFDPFNLKILNVYLETWLWSPLICVGKALREGVDIWDYMKTYTFTLLFIFNIFCFIIIIIIYIIIFLLLLVYISHYYRYCYYLNYF